MTSATVPDPLANALRAAAWMLGAIVSFTSMAVAGRAVSFELDTFEIMLFRSLIGLAIVLVIARSFGHLHEIRARHMPLHIVRNSCHFAGQNLWFYAITVAPLAQVFALEFTSPLWVTVLAPLVLGERLTRTRVLAALLGFLGILVVARPGAEAFSPGLVAAAIAAVCFAGSAVFTRRLTRTETITCIMFWLTVIQTVLGLGFAGFDGDIALPSATSWPWLVLIGCAGLLAHFCLTKALSLAPATVVMPIDFARLPIVALVGMWVYGEVLDPIVFVGAAVIFGANYLNIRAESRRA
ncbi:MAG: DMT family transporter [Paracoccaceae bacterium]